MPHWDSHSCVLNKYRKTNYKIKYWDTYVIYIIAFTCSCPCPRRRIWSCERRAGCDKNALIQWEKCWNNQIIKIKQCAEIACVIMLQWYILNMLFLYRRRWKWWNGCIDQLWWISLMDHKNFLQIHCLHMQLHVNSYLFPHQFCAQPPCGLYRGCESYRAQLIQFHEFFLVLCS